MTAGIICCNVCGRPAPSSHEAHVGGDWFRVDLDGNSGPIERLWFCDRHHDPAGERAIAAAIHRARQTALGCAEASA